MFQTEPILFLQSFASVWLTWLMQAVTAMGYAPFFVVALAFVLFAVDLRRGFVLTQLVIITNLVTDVVKWAFDLPRPIDVDSRVVDPRRAMANPTPWRGRGAAGFLSPLGADVVAAFRAHAGRSMGFPSGHVSTTAALWGGASALFRLRVLFVAAAVAVPLIALSRMYLGRHFVADVLGGALLGAVIVGVTYAATAAARAPAPLVALHRLGRLVPWRRVAVATWLLAVPAALLACGGIVDRQRVGHLLGLNLAYLAIAARGVPDTVSGWRAALARLALGATLGVAAAYAARSMAAAGLLGEAGAFARVASGALVAFVLLWGMVTLGLRLDLYRDPDRAGDLG